MKLTLAWKRKTEDEVKRRAHGNPSCPIGEKESYNWVLL